MFRKITIFCDFWAEISLFLCFSSYSWLCVAKNKIKVNFDHFLTSLSICLFNFTLPIELLGIVFVNCKMLNIEN